MKQLIHNMTWFRVSLRIRSMIYLHPSPIGRGQG
jgi:hypothetical protein